MAIVGVADLGGLGDQEGPRVFYRWRPTHPLPALLPWLGVLLLLLLKGNRTGQAWWIWGPLGALATLGGSLPPLLASGPSIELGILQELVGALAFGLAAVWLTSHDFGRGSRFAAFLGLVLVLFGASSFVVLCRHLEHWDNDARPAGEFAGAASLAIAVTLALAGLLCRRRCGLLVLCFWVLVLVLPVWLAVIMLWLVIDAFSLGFSIDMHQIMVWIIGVGGLAKLSLAVLLPFLILSFANPLYRERLMNLLRPQADAAASQLSESVPGRRKSC